MSNISKEQKRDKIADASRGTSWLDGITHQPLVGRYLQQAGCVEQVWAISKKKDDQSFGALTTYVDAQKGCEDRLPNLLAIPHYLRLKYADMDDGPDQTGLTSEEEIKMEEVLKAKQGSVRMSEVLTFIPQGPQTVKSGEHTVPSCDLCGNDIYVVPCTGCGMRFCDQCQRTQNKRIGRDCMCDVQPAPDSADPSARTVSTVPSGTKRRRLQKCG